MFGIGRLPELIILLIVILLIVGPGKLPSLGRGLGEMIRGFRQESGTDAAKKHANSSSEPSPKS